MNQARANPTPGAAPAPSIDGTWRGTAHLILDSETEGTFPVKLTLSEDVGGDVSGEGEPFPDDPSVHGSFAVTGRVDGPAVHLVLNDVAQGADAVDFHGTVTATTLAGTFTFDGSDAGRMDLTRQ